MNLADTSVWIDHLRSDDKTLARLLDAGMILIHPFIIGEVALGNLRQRDVILDAMRNLPRTAVATDEEVLHMISRDTLFGLGIGYIDAHLLAAVRLTSGSSLWTRDKRLRAVAERLRLAASLP